MLAIIEEGKKKFLFNYETLRENIVEEIDFMLCNTDFYYSAEEEFEITLSEMVRACCGYFVTALIELVADGVVQDSMTGYSQEECLAVLQNNDDDAYNDIYITMLEVVERSEDSFYKTKAYVEKKITDSDDLFMIFIGEITQLLNDLQIYYTHNENVFYAEGRSLEKINFNTPFEAVW